ncbi:MAG: DUF5666 domain-containing protein [candidate division KSB1 bacterium]|nr:DUF5666 domain-containing protein [candidate division KSB1 bacterium]MDZ7300642.1 DUF5666 domain-containing protein [candidate division KSB1 bacterium]MDZ7309779.1 DUF5666 domain-containing protein [candidate division KSB1 bacterium]
MRLHLALPIIVILALCCPGSIPLRAQNVKKWTPAEIIANAKPGRWVEIDGLIKKDQSVLALEIEFPAGDFMDDDWRLLGKVRAVTPAKNELQMLWMLVKVTKATEFNDGIKSLEDIKPEMLVKLEGTYLKDGIFLAKEVDDRTKKLKAEPEFDRMLEVVGKVEQVDEAKRMITVMGIQFHITRETEGKSLIK